MPEVKDRTGLVRQLEKAGLGFEEEKPVEIYVDGSSVGLLYLDHLVEGTVVVEEESVLSFGN